MNPGPVGGVGDTIAGLLLDKVQIVSAICTAEVACPGSFDLTLTNMTDAAGRWEVLAYVYRDGVASLGNSTFIELSPGATAVAKISIDTTQAPSDGRAATYTWNWSAVLTR